MTCNAAATASSSARTPFASARIRCCWRTLPRPGRATRAVDLGCGTGAIATLMAAHEPTLCVDAVELQPDVADMARRSVRLNRLEGRVRVFAGDMRAAHAFLGHGQYALAVCNPPYGRARARRCPAPTRACVWRDNECGLGPADVAKSAARLLKNGGRLCVIFPAPRALEMLRAMEDAGIAPKRLRTVHGMPGRAPKFLLIEGVRGGGGGAALAAAAGAARSGRLLQRGMEAHLPRAVKGAPLPDEAARRLRPDDRGAGSASPASGTIQSPLLRAANPCNTPGGRGSRATSRAAGRSQTPLPALSRRGRAL